MPRLIVKRTDNVKDAQPSMSVLVNGKTVIGFLTNHAEKETLLEAGAYVVQLHCFGRKSRPVAITMSEGRDTVLMVGINQKGKVSPWLIGLTAGLWAPLMFTRNLWLSIIWAVAIILLNVWIYRRRKLWFDIQAAND